MRLSAIDLDNLTPAQAKARDSMVSGARGRIPQPAMAWLHSPEYADKVQSLGALLRYGTRLPPALSEMAILVTARHWTSHYEWFAHRQIAEEAGLSTQIVEAIRHRRTPEFSDPAAKAIYDYALELQTTHQVSRALHDAVVGYFGEAGVVELVGLLGYYTLVSMTLNAFEMEIPGGVKSELE